MLVFILISTSIQGNAANIDCSDFVASTLHNPASKENKSVKKYYRKILFNS